MALLIAESSAVISIALQTLVILGLLFGIHKATQKLSLPENEKKLIFRTGFVFVVGWFLLALTLAVLDALHVSSNLISPGIPIFFVLAMVLGLKVIPKWKYFEQLLDAFPLHWLFLLQVPRVLGIVFLGLMDQGQLPALFAIPSAFGDMITGLLAIVVAYWYWAKKQGAKKFAIVWNYFGILDLILAISLGVLLAFPVPFQIIPVTITTEIMTVFPMALVPTFAVPMGLLLHFYSLRVLNKK
ncbi:MAG: hypothetical protein Q7S92_01430 [Candidatus Diapherotrites archaeon]|nr:hypothetical protein [Candidatus Diapherotrites archaeon]